MAGRKFQAMTSANRNSSSLLNAGAAITRFA